LATAKANSASLVHVNSAITLLLAGLVTGMFGKEDDVVNSPLMRDGISGINSPV
ncbi:MAG: hypothetical protein ACJAS1_007304, partial [Oleiphilaceae bacterium]